MKPIVVRKTINAPISKVWKAITNRKEMVQWFFENIPAFKPEVSFTTQFNVKSSERNFLHVWKVTEVEFEKKIVCEWKYPEYVDKPLFVSFEIKKIQQNKTEFKVTALGIEYFSELDILEFKRESCVGGWAYFSNRLKEYLET